MNDLTYTEISKYLQPELSKTLEVFETVDSTNTQLKLLAASGVPHGTVIVADSQTGGRGRLGRAFYSPEGAGIYMSILLRPDTPSQELANITALAAVAVSDAIEEICFIRPGIKWVNDLYLDGKKICGILAEGVTSAGTTSALVIGVGVNVKKSKIPNELKGIIGSIEGAGVHPVSRAQLAAKMIEKLCNMTENVDNGLEKYRDNCITLGREVEIASGEFAGHGRAVGLTDDCGLIVEYDNGTQRTITFGEVSVKNL